jgi:hypothetical protein
MQRKETLKAFDDITDKSLWKQLVVPVWLKWVGI